MKSKSFSTIVLAVLSALHSSYSFGVAQEKYQTSEASEGVELIYKMQEAHGGLAKWQEKSTIYFERDHYNIHPKGEMLLTTYEFMNNQTGEIRQEWPGFKAAITWDGNKVGTSEWHNQFPLPADFLVRTGVWFSALPFRISDKTHDIKSLGKQKWVIYGKEEEEFYAVQAVDKITGEELTFYINPNDYLLQGCQFYFTDRKLLDLFGVSSDVDRLGPNIWRIDSHITRDNFILPGQYSAFDQTGARRNRGEYKNHSFGKGFVSIKTAIK